MLMRDPYIGHRNTSSGAPDGPATEWTAWDFSLASAMQIIEDSTTEHGHLIWELEDDNVDIQAVRKVDKAKAAIDRITDRENYKSQPGEYYVTRMIHPYLGEDEKPVWQTRQEWMRKKIEET